MTYLIYIYYFYFFLLGNRFVSFIYYVQFLLINYSVAKPVEQCRKIDKLNASTKLRWAQRKRIIHPLFINNDSPLNLIFLLCLWKVSSKLFFKKCLFFYFVYCNITIIPCIKLRDHKFYWSLRLIIIII